MSKKPLDVARMTRLLNHGPTVLASCYHGGRGNIITLAWTSPVSIDPPLVAVAIAPARFSHALILRSREYVINVPSPRLLDAVWYCGSRSGRDVDKFRESGLSAAEAAAVRAPLIDECFAHVECGVVRTFSVGDHTVFVGEPRAASVERDAFDGHLTLRGRFHTLHHLGGRRFVTSAGTKLTA